MKVPASLLLILSISLAHAEIYDGPPPKSRPYDGPPPAAPEPAESPEAQDQYVAIAAGITPYDWEKGSTVNVGGSRRDTPELAREQALTRCRNPDYPELQAVCKIVYEAHHGCIYAVKGTAPWGYVGYGLGATPQAAYDACQTNKLNCFTDAHGGCANPAFKPHFPAIAPAPRMRTVYALAVGVARESDGRGSISLAGSEGPDLEFAKNIAVTNCNRGNEIGRGRPVCEVVKTFDHGCYYISTGWIEGQWPVSRWALGTSEDDAIRSCEGTGATNCPRSKVRGGCAQE